MIAIGVMVGSFRQTVTYWLDSILTADIVVKPVMNSSSQSSATIDEATVDTIQHDPDVKAMCWYSSRHIPYAEGMIRLDTTDLKPFLEFGALFSSRPGQRERMCSRASNQTRLRARVRKFLTAAYKNPGDRVQLSTPEGAVKYPSWASTMITPATKEPCCSIPQYQRFFR